MQPAHKRSTNRSRRQFLGRAAGLAAGALGWAQFVPARALGRGTTPPSERIGVALIGCGGRGIGEAQSSLAQSDKCQILAVCDPWDSKTARARETFQRLAAERLGKQNVKGCDCYRDFRDVLARPDIDAVYIATSDHWHVPITIAAARAGKDMHTEKPLGISIEHDLAARQAVRRYDRVFQYGTERRSTPTARHAIELVLNGRIGKVQALYVNSPGSIQGGSPTPVLPVPQEFDYDLWLGPAPEAPYCRDRCLTPDGIYHLYDYAIGFIAGWAAHPLDMLQWWADQLGLGIPVTYEGRGRLPESGLYDTVLEWDMLCRYENGLTLRFMDNQTSGRSDIPGMRGPNAATFVGTEGWISVSYDQIQASQPSLLRSVVSPNEIRLPRSSEAGTPYVEAHHLSWLDCVRTRQDPVSNIDSAVRSDLISHLCDIAVRRGRPIRWDQVRETIVDDEMARRMMSRPMRGPWQL